MLPDYAFVGGLLVAMFAITSLISAFSDRRTPRLSLVFVIVSGGLITYAFWSKPGGYVLAQVPEVIFRVIGDLIS